MDALISKRNLIRLGLWDVENRCEKDPRADILDLGSSHFRFRHTPPFIHGSLSSQTLSQSTVVEFTICLAFYPHALFLSGSKVYAE